MKVFLIGGLGFIGTRFIRKFSNTHQIIVYTKRKDDLEISKMNFLKNVILEYGSVVDKDITNKMEKHNPDAVIHLAALSGLQRCHDDPQLAFSTNVYGTFNVINSCKRVGAKLIFCSTREVYGETIDEKSKEEDPLLPNNIYGLTKKLAEDLIRLASQKMDLNYIILRPTNVYGPEGDKYGAEIIINDAIKKNMINILGGTQRLNYVYVDDVVDVLDFVLKKNISRETFNVGSTDTITIIEFAKEVFRALNSKGKIEYLPMRKTETSNFVPEITKLQSIMVNFPKTSLRSGIEKTIKWYS